MNPFTFRTKPQGVWANFRTDCHRCKGEVTVSHGRVDPHHCQPERPVTVYADHADVSEWRAVRKQILDKLETEMNNH